MMGPHNMRAIRPGLGLPVKYWQRIVGIKAASFIKKGEGLKLSHFDGLKPFADKKIIATIEARMTSSRLPGKVMKPIMERPSLELLIERLKHSKYLHGICIATTVNQTDEPLVELANKLNVSYYRGSENDVLDRVLKAAQSVEADIIVEITGDCTLIDPAVVDECIAAYLEGQADYVCNFLEKSFPGGLEAQVFSTRLLAGVAAATQDPEDREHVSLYIYTHPEQYRLKNIKAPPALTAPEIMLPLDTQADYEKITAVFENLYPSNPAFGTADVIRFLKANPEISALNKEVKRTVVKKLQ